MTPERDAVTRARVAIERSWSVAERELGGQPDMFVPQMLDAYRDALLAEVVAVVEGQVCLPTATRAWVDRENLLAAIRALTEAK
jgi:hypothetical protein